MKRKLGVCLATVLLCSAFFGGCTGGSEKVVFNEYWFKDSNFATNGAETLSYNVSFEEGSGFGDGKLELDYTGTYTTTLLPNTVYNEQTGVYYYETNLDLDVTFTVKGETETKTDAYVKTKAYFKTAKDGLCPLYVFSEYHSYVPNNSATSLSNAYSETKATVETVYGANGTSGVCTQTDKLNDKVYKNSFSANSKDAKKYSCLDVEQLYFALRGVNSSENATPKFLVYSAGNEAYQSVTASFGSKVVGDTQFSGVLNSSVDYYPVSVSLNAELSGTNHIVWISAHSNPQQNANRNVILRMEANFPYNMGKLIYKLNSASFSN